MIRWIFIAAVGLTACEGQIAAARPDVGDVGISPDLPTAVDMTVAPDTGPMVDPLCVAVTCLPNSECGRGSCWCSAGFMGDPNVGCTPGNPCADADCTFGATCKDDGECSCDLGFEENLNTCEAVDDSLIERTVADVCARWRSDYPETAGVQWQTDPIDQCDPGELDPAFQLDAIRRLTLYRWLVGLPAVTTTAEYMEETQACATTLNAHDVGATNTIAEDFTCYSGQAAAGAQASSVLRGAASPAAAVDRFLEDAEATSLGNRRWIFNPEMGASAFGFRGDYTCMYAIDTNGGTNPQFIGYPSGIFPQEAVRGRWMWASGQLFANEDTTVTVLDSAGTNVPVTNLTLLPGNIFPGAVAWEVGALAPGEYTVTLQGIAGAVNQLTYPVNIVTCP